MRPSKHSRGSLAWVSLWFRAVPLGGQGDSAQRLSPPKSRAQPAQRLGSKTVGGAGGVTALETAVSPVMGVPVTRRDYSLPKRTRPSEKNKSSTSPCQ